MKNLAKTGAVYDGTINGVFTPANPLIKAKRTPCMDFISANSNYISIVNPVTGMTQCTIVAWINQDIVTKCIFSSAGAWGTYIFIEAGPEPYLYILNPVSFIRAGRRKPLNTTFMLAVTRETTGIGRMFIDGNQVAVGALDACNVAANAFIGRVWDGSFRYDGRLDNMLFYNIALTPAQIQSIWRSANPR